MQEINVLLSEMDNGALQERFNYEFAEVTKNIMDPNTDAIKKRQIVITVDVLGDEYRDQVRLATQVKSKLVPRDSVSSKVEIGQKRDGTVVANEIKSGEVGQMFFDEKDATLKDDKGTPVEEIEAQQEQAQNGVIDFRGKAQTN
ncbi:hypothetical protein [Enterococcus avium]|uniref:hypothetical protein n=1 Tax=Enterococcus avium TaxID=33945 RepID=UPI00288EC7AA|nr:hypothetical protein [Enterococcus avium]MDT2479096.1 hypothetical protein [Enterococcus avium]